MEYYRKYQLVRHISKCSSGKAWKEDSDHLQIRYDNESNFEYSSGCSIVKKELSQGVEVPSPDAIKGHLNRGPLLNFLEEDEDFGAANRVANLEVARLGKLVIFPYKATIN